MGRVIPPHFNMTIMKNTFLFFIILCIWEGALGQNFVSISLNYDESGRNITLDYFGKIKNKHEIGGGLRININSITQPDDQSNIYYRRLYATEPYQYFGLHGFYHRRFFERWDCFQPYAFYDIQISKSTTRSSMFIPYSLTPEGEILYKNVIEYFGPFIWIDQNIGIGFRVKVYKIIDIFENFGIGCSWIIGNEEMLPSRSAYSQYEFGYLLTFGASVNL
jgi:hypothetical protein